MKKILIAVLVIAVTFAHVKCTSRSPSPYQTMSKSGITVKPIIQKK